MFAATEIKKGKVIETCPVIIAKKEDKEYLRKTDLLNYYFRWDIAADNHQAAICLGYGSIYNHSYTPNAIIERKLSEGVIEFIAHHDILKDEEITFNYNGDPNSTKKLWMSDVPDAGSAG